MKQSHEFECKQFTSLQSSANDSTFPAIPVCLVTVYANLGHSKYALSDYTSNKDTW